MSAALVQIVGIPTVVTSGRDVTERKRLRTKLLVSDRMASLGTLAAGIAHEINNPLAYVTGNLEVIAETLEEARRAPADQTLDDINAAVIDARDGAERVRKIVLGLRAFTRSDEDHLVPVELAGVLEAAIRMTGNEVRHRAELIRELAATPPVLGDDGRLTQVFINLLVNAAHAIPEGHSADHAITVRSLTDDRGQAVIEIEDTGTGMTPEVQARVFDPFFTTKDVGMGTGLGLSICHGIVDALGGQISIESPPARSRRTGTLVRVVLPCHAVAPGPVAVAARDEVPAVPGESRRHRVMLVDDEPLVGETMGRLLRRDYDVTVVSCGEDAIQHITRGARFDVIVSDVMMPTMTGVELRDELERLAPDQARRLIFVSGGAFTTQTRQRLEQIGAPQLANPVTATALRACVLQVASHHDLPSV
jgi:nitrogen-specific signal transduction histidine kinase/CheY-like chemotaxis protein